MQKMSSKGRCESDAEDYTFNVVLLGAKKVGKTSFVQKAGCGDVEDDTYKTLAVKDIDTGRPIKLNFFDSVHEEGLIEKAHVVICLADITVTDGCDTFLRSYWHVKSMNRGGIPYIAVGTKLDLDDIRSWKAKQARADCDCGDIPYIEVSSKTGKNVKEAIRMITDAALQWAKKYRVTYETGDPFKDPEQHLVSEDDEQEELNGGCCIVS